MSTNRTNRPPINHIQALYFELIRTIEFNELVGARIVENLLEWRDLWESVIMDRLPMPRGGPLVPGQFHVYPPLGLLRTTRGNDWPADTLYIWTDEARLPKLRALIGEHWELCEISLVDQHDVEMMMSIWGTTDRVLQIWWD
jgi:hypothetical protein